MCGMYKIKKINIDLPWIIYVQASFHAGISAAHQALFIDDGDKTLTRMHGTSDQLFYRRPTLLFH